MYIFGLLTYDYLIYLISFSSFQFIWWELSRLLADNFASHLSCIRRMMYLSQCFLIPLAGGVIVLHAYTLLEYSIRQFMLSSSDCRIKTNW